MKPAPIQKATLDSTKRLSAFANGALVPAILGLLTVQLFRVTLWNKPFWMWLEVAFFIATSIVLKVLLSRMPVQTNRKSKKISATVTSNIGASIILLLFFASQSVGRAFNVGDAYEVSALITLQYVAFFLALVRSDGCEKLSFILSGSVVFFTCCMTQRIDLWVISGCFIIAALWWLLGLYWRKLDKKAIDGQARMLPVRASFVGLALLSLAIAAGVACLVPISKGTFNVAGFSWFSGGTNGDSDPFARSGIGEGNMLTSGENAATTGAVDTDQFIEDEKPSLYDMISDRYEGPVAKKRRNRAIALNKKTKHMHNVKQSEINGKTFRTMRQKDEKNKKLDLENKVTDALFFVEGSVPARFTVGSYEKFDGWDWEACDAEKETHVRPLIQLTEQFKKPVFQLAQAEKKFLTGSRIHTLKIMRLDTNRLPTSAFLKSWHIAFMNQADFFDWNDQNLIQMDSEMIPSQTVIHMKSSVPNFHIMRKMERLNGSHQALANSNSKSRSDSVYVQLPDSSGIEKLKPLVETWIAGIEPGWNQIETITKHVREDFELQPEWTIDPEAPDSIGLFLEQNGGPSYMFATTCAMALRIAGYRTRMANGFLVSKKHYNSLAGQSAVTSDCVHLWPQVCLEGTYWIPVEPTPGYPMPYNTATMLQKAIALVLAVWNWILANPIFTLAALLSSWALWFWRTDLIAAGLLLRWHLVRIFNPLGLLRATRQLIDIRFWAAGDSRPKSKTIATWYRRISPDISSDFLDLWNAKNYSREPHERTNGNLNGTCHEAIQELSLRRIRGFVLSQEEQRRKLDF